MTTPLQFGDPPTLGPFRLHARLREGPAGITYLGTDAQGRDVSVALLTRGAASDPAARDRFRAAVTGGLGVDRGGAPVVTADPDGPAPWVATAYVPHEAGAERFLDPVAMTDATSTAMVGEGGGPEFEPHWAGAAEPAVPAAPLPAMPQPVDGGGPRVGLVLGIVAAVLLLVVGLVSGSLLLVSRATSTRPTPNPTPGATSAPGQTSTAPTPSPGGASPTAAPLRTGGPTVVGGTWGSGDDTYTMENLSGLGFSFRVPEAWGCLRSSRATPPDVRWVCIDEQWQGDDVPHLVLQVSPCDAPCDRKQQRRMPDAFDVEGEWKRSDATTTYAEWTDRQKGTRFYNLAMSHFWHSGGSAGLNSRVQVIAAGPTKTKSDLRKIVNDIRANTP